MIDRIEVCRCDDAVSEGVRFDVFLADEVIFGGVILVDRDLRREARSFSFDRQFRSVRDVWQQSGRAWSELSGVEDLVKSLLVRQ